MQSAANCCSIAIDSSPVVDMTVPILMTQSIASVSSVDGTMLRDTFNLCHPEIAALLLKRVLKALLMIKLSLDKCNNKKKMSKAVTEKAEVADDCTHTFQADEDANIDMRMMELFNIIVPIRAFPIHETFKCLESATGANATVTPLDHDKQAQAHILSLKQGLDALRGAFTIELLRSFAVPSGPNAPHVYVYEEQHGRTNHFEYKVKPDPPARVPAAATAADSDSTLSPTLCDRPVTSTFYTKVSAEQYFTLLQLYKSSPAVDRVMQAYRLQYPSMAQSPMQTKIHQHHHEQLIQLLSASDPISCLQTGRVTYRETVVTEAAAMAENTAGSTTVNETTSDITTSTTAMYGNNADSKVLNRFVFQLCFDPTARYILQLQQLAQQQERLTQLVTRAADSIASEYLQNPALVKILTRQHKRYTCALTAALGALELRQTAMEVSEEGDFEMARKIISHALDTPHKPFSTNDDNDEDDDEGNLYY